MFCHPQSIFLQCAVEELSPESESCVQSLWDGDFFTVWLRLFTGVWWRGRVVMMMMVVVVLEMWLLAVQLYLCCADGCSPVQPVAVGAADISEVWVGVGFGGEGLLAAAPCWQQLPLLGISPFHPAVLKPDLHLYRTQKTTSQDLITCNFSVSAV